MSFITMQKELLGDLPGLPLPYAKTIINRALGMIYDEQRWSFQVGENGWLTPGLLGGNSAYQSPGTITVAPYSTSIIGDAVATALWLAQMGRPFLTEQQIRVPEYSLYNIIGYDNGQTVGQGNYPYATLTIDRPWMEPAQVAATYMIYQAYFPVGVLNFRKFGTIRDTTNNFDMDFESKDQQWLARHDPQRTDFNTPAYVIPYEVDRRPGSATLGQMLYELWPHPLTKLPYTYSYVWSGPLLSLPTDIVPYPLNDELVTWRAREVGYLWKESQKGDGMQRGSGADWRFLAQEAHAQYEKKLEQAKLLDAGLGDLYWNKFERRPMSNDGYETVNGSLNVGSW